MEGQFLPVSDPPTKHCQETEDTHPSSTDAAHLGHRCVFQHPVSDPENTGSTPPKPSSADATATGSTAIRQRSTEQVDTVPEHKLESCIMQLRAAFPLREKENYDEFKRPGNKIDNHFWYSNEFPGKEPETVDYNRTIQALSEIPPPPGDSLRVAMLVGESSLLASLPELHKVSDLVLLLDYDAILLHALIRSLLVIQRCESLEDEQWFLDLMTQEAIPTPEKAASAYDITDFKEQYSESRQALGAHHPFSSEARLKEVKKAAKTLRVLPIFTDICDTDNMENLAEILTSFKAKIHFLNMSNVLEPFLRNPSCPPFDFEPLEKLPLAEHAMIADSLLMACGKNQTRIFSNPSLYWSAIRKDDYQPITAIISDGNRRRQPLCLLL